METTTSAGARQRPNKSQRRGITAFLLISFGLAWLPFSPALFGRDPVGAMLMAFAPAIAAFIVRRWVTREGFADAGLRLNLRHWPFYVLAFSWPLATIPLAVLLARALGVAPSGSSLPWGVAAPEVLTMLVWAVAAIASSPVFLGEEFGWRGYLQRRLLADKPLQAAVATGLIWGVWHYPMILTGGQSTQSRFWTLLAFPVGAIVLSIFFGWLRTQTGAIWAGSGAHATNNMAENSWWRLGFTGRTDGVPSMSAAGPLLLAETIVLTGVVAGYRLFSQRRPLRVGAVPSVALAHRQGQL